MATYLDDLVAELRLRGLHVHKLTIDSSGVSTASLALGAGGGPALVDDLAPLILLWQRGMGWELRRTDDHREPTVRRYLLTDEREPSPAALACLLLDAIRP